MSYAARLTLFVGYCLLASSVGQPAVAATPDVQATGPVEKIQGDFQFTEGPTQAADGTVYFTDIPANQIWAYTPADKAVPFIEPSLHANGLMFEAGGRLLACQMDGQVVVYDLKTKESQLLADQYDGKRFNAPNDLVIDSVGGVYFTDPLYRAPEPLPQGIQAVYYIDVQGKVSRLTGALPAPNGIGLSPDGKTLYVIPSQSKEMLAYDVDGPGKVSNQRVFCQLQQASAEENAGGDGMAVDTEGNIYITTGLGVQVYSPAGKLVTIFEFPEHPANVTFGGPERKHLYVTARTGLYRLPVSATGVPAATLRVPAKSKTEDDVSSSMVAGREYFVAVSQGQDDAIKPERSGELSDDQLRAYVEMLGAPNYHRREVAMRLLEGAGQRVIEPLEEAIASGNLEIVNRANQILQSLAILELPSDRPVAWNALQRVKQFGPGSASTRADSAIEMIESDRSQRAHARLAAAGLVAGQHSFVFGGQNHDAKLILFPGDWKVDQEALSWLSWMYDTTTVVVQEDAITEEVLTALSTLPGLRDIQIRDGKLSTAGLKLLGKMKRINTLELLYVEIGDNDEDLFALAELPLRERLILIGTGFDREDASALQGNLKNLEIVYSEGGFLGVQCYSTQLQCEISRIVPGSAAERAGLMVGDVIIQLGEIPVVKFDDLLEAVRTFKPGSKVELKARRGGEVLSFEIQLGRMQ